MATWALDFGSSDITSSREATVFFRLSSLSAIPDDTLVWLRCVGTARFEAFWGFMTIANSVVLVVETDFRQGDKHPGWLVADSGFTVLFLVELLIRLVALRSSWPRNLWNIFDAFLVACSIIDVWLLPLIRRRVQLRTLSLLRVGRLLRMLRILRILRLLRFARELLLLAHALWGALRAMFWAMVLVALVTILPKWGSLAELAGSKLVIYTFGILITRLVQLDESLWDDELVREWFGTFPRSLFTLLQLMTLEGWPDIARTTLTSHPWLTVLYLCFILLTNMTLLNIIAGVLTENVLSTSRKDEEKRQMRLERCLQEEMHYAGEELAAADADGDGLLSLQELRAASRVPHLSHFLQLAGLSLEEAENLFHLVDFDSRGTVCREDFVDAVRRARGSVKSKHLVGLKRDILRASAELNNVSALLLRVTSRAAELRAGSPGGPSRCDTNEPSTAEDEISSVDGRFMPEAAAKAAPSVAELRQEFRDRMRELEQRLTGPVARPPEPKAVEALQSEALADSGERV